MLILPLIRRAKKLIKAAPKIKQEQKKKSREKKKKFEKKYGLTFVIIKQIKNL